MIRFGKIPVDKQVFYMTERSFALVNYKPLLPYHVLVCPRRVVPRLKDLSPDEMSDLFLTVQKVSSVVESVAQGDALNIAVQDGALAGQSVPHVHCHIIPRSRNDLPADEIYNRLESEDADIEIQFQRQKHARTKFPAPDKEADRQPRSSDEMEHEARELAGHFKDSLLGKM